MALERNIYVDRDNLAQDAVPRHVEVDEIPVRIKAYSEKIYVDFPDWSGNITTDDVGLPMWRSDLKTTQFLMDAMSVFRCFVEYSASALTDEPEVRPRRRMLRFYSDGGHATSTRTFRNDGPFEDWDIDPVHRRLCVAFHNALELGDSDDEYWTGYKDGSGCSWNDVALKCVEKNWEGSEKLMAEVGEWLARDGTVISARSNALFDIPEWSTTPGGGYVNTISSIESTMCPDCGSDLSETQTCYSSSNRTRKADKYKCDPEKGGCGYRFSGITTG